MANISEPEDGCPPRWKLAVEAVSLLARLPKTVGRGGERGPAEGAKLMVIPGFLANDATTLPLQRALARAGFRVTGWGLGLNEGVKPDTLDGIIARLDAFGGGAPVILVGWSLGGIYAREVAKRRPELVAKVVTLGSPFSGDRRANNVWRLYEWVAGHPVDKPPIDADPSEKPPVPTLALWSRRDGIVAAAAARGQAGEADQALEMGCTHMGFALSGRALPAIVEAVKSF